MNILPKKKIVLLGMMSHMPVGGNVWLVAQYLLGFQRLGYDPYYVEAHGINPSMLMQPDDKESATLASSFIGRIMTRLGLADHWAYHTVRVDGCCYGMSESQLRELYRTAHLIINLHGGTEPLPEHYATNRLVYLGTDPVQLEIELHDQRQETIDFLAPHCAFFTWGENYGRPDCLVPCSDRFLFRPTRAPLVLELWQSVYRGGTTFTTIGNWRQLRREVTFRGEVYHWSKHYEFLKFLDLPRRSGQSFELALSRGTCTDEDRQLLEANGWRVCDSLTFSTDLDAYRRYIARSRGEFTVAKDQNVRLRSGWFSERSAQYLAASRPVITQETGFSNILPTGEGLFAFSTLDEAAAAVEAINSDYERHCRAAREIAHEYFSYDVVLSRMLSELGIQHVFEGADVATTTSNGKAMELPKSATSSDSAQALSSDKKVETETGSFPDGINLVGYLRTESGVGAAARNYLRALQTLSLPVSLHDVSDVQGNRSQDRTILEFGATSQYEVNLVCVDAQVHYAVRSALGEDFFEGRYNIAIWAWEQLRFPEKWYDRFAYYDEIWVGTSFIANVLAPIAPIPVIRVPPVLTLAEPDCRQTGRHRLGVNNDDFVFLFIFDFHSRARRKNPLAVIRAFKTAFGSSERARLVMKCVNAHSARPDFDQMRQEAEGYPITLYEGYWPIQDVRDLMAACDSYVSLHRSEGTGLTISDAMALGKPVIATGWSGNMDFMNVNNSFPVAYELVKLEENAGPYQAGELWADPSVTHAAELMRQVYTDREGAAARGRVAQQDLQAHYSEKAVAVLIRQRLDAIALRRRFGAFQETAHSQFRYYLGLPGRLREAVRTSVPDGANILVVSKGDDKLLNLGSCAGGHFPQDEHGVYAGYYPVDSNDAIKHLESLRAEGAGFLLLPSPAFWWLEHYADFGKHLESRYSRIQSNDHCLIYDLADNIG
jgi:glycosyltransferase involved in cell wall biosynthesis